MLVAMVDEEGVVVNVIHLPDDYDLEKGWNDHRLVPGNDLSIGDKVDET